MTIGPPETKFTMILTFVFVSLLIPSLAVIDARILLRGTMIFPIFAIFKLDTVFATTKDWTDYVSMDVSYGFLIPIAAAIIYSFLYLHDDRLIVRTLMLVIVAVNSVFGAILFVRGSRGSLLSVILLILFIYSVKHKTNGYGVSYSKGKIGTFLFVLFFLLLGYVFFVGVIVDILATMGIKSYALSKIIELENMGDISNGRSALNLITLNGIIEHPILGNGFDRFNANTNLLYPHNFVLQILYDGGLLFFIVLMIPVIKGTFRLYKMCTIDEYAVLTFLIFSSVPGALFSHNLYSDGILWMYFGCSLSKNFVRNSQVAHSTNSHEIKNKNKII